MSKQKNLDPGGGASGAPLDPPVQEFHVACVYFKTFKMLTQLLSQSLRQGLFQQDYNVCISGYYICMVILD